MYILGINISHETSCCLLKDGEIVYHIEDSRITRIKDIMAPMNEFDDIICSYEKNKFIEPAKFVQADIIAKYTHEIDYIIFTSYGRSGANVEQTISGFEDKILIKSIIKTLSEKNISFKSSFFFLENHHIYHASNAFYASGFDNAVALIMDGGGSFDPKYMEEYTSKKSEFPFREVETIWECSYNSDNNIVPKWRHYSNLDDHDEDFFWKKSNNEIYSISNSAGNYFAAACNIFDMEVGEQGKVMGLSGHRLTSRDANIINKIIERFEGEKSIFLDNWYSNIDGVEVSNINLLPYCEDFFDEHDIDMNFEEPNLDFYVCASLAHKLQEETFRHTCKLIQKAIDITGKTQIVLSGGYFMNCVNNYKYTQEFPNLEFFVDPIPHDGGTAIGAAKYLWYKLTKSKEKFPFNNLYFGSRE